MSSYTVINQEQDVIKKDLDTAFREIYIGYGLLKCNKDQWSSDDYQWLTQGFRELADIAESYQLIALNQQA